MKNQIKKLIAVILLTLGTIFVSLAQTHYEKTVRTQGKDISIDSLVINKRPYGDIKKTRILAKNGTEFAITFPEKYQNLSIVRDNQRIEIQGRKVIVKESGSLSFKFTYTENGVSYTCDILGHVNYYGELKCGDRAAPEIIDVIRSGQSIREGRTPTPHRETMKLEASEKFAGVWWGFYVPNLDIKNPTLEQLQKFEETIFSDKKQITLGELLEVGRQKGKLQNGQLDVVVEFGDNSSNALENWVPGGTSLQMITLKDARTYNLNLSQVGQGTVSVSKNQLKSGESTTLTARAAQGWRFDHWEENGQNVTENPLTITMGTQDRSIKAVFTELPKVMVTLQIVDTNGGELAPSQSQEVTSGGTVTFQVPNLANVSFKGWKRNGQIVETGSSYMLSNVTQNETIQAVFEVPVQSITVTPTSITAKVGEGPIQLTATVLPANATSKTITWISENEQVVKVDSSGKVTIIGAGETAIEAKAGEKTFTVQVKIEAQSQPQQPQPQQPQNPKVLVESLSLSFAELSLKVGEAKDLPSVTITPSNATDQAITWISNKPEVAKVENGKVVGVSSGTVQIIASSTNSKTAMLNVTVTPENQVAEEDFPPYVKELPNFKVGQVVNLDDLVWERRDGIEIEEYLLLDTQGKLLPLGTEYQREANKLTFSAARVFVLVVKFKQNARNWQQVEFTIEVKP